MSDRNRPSLMRFLFYSGKRPSYMMHNSPYTRPQFRTGMDHFLVASKVARYKAFNKAVSLGNTLLWRFNLRYVEFSDSIEFVVLYRYRYSTTNAIEGFNRQLRKVTKSKTIFPSDDSLLKMLYLAMMDITKKWTGRMRTFSWTHVDNPILRLYSTGLIPPSEIFMRFSLYHSI